MAWAVMRLRSEQIAAVAQDHSRRALAEAFAPQRLTAARGPQPNLVILRDPEGATVDAHGLIAPYRHPIFRRIAPKLDTSPPDHGILRLDYELLSSQAIPEQHGDAAR